MKNFRRKTMLDEPKDDNFTTVHTEEDTTMEVLAADGNPGLPDQKLTKEEQIDDDEIKQQYIACNEEIPAQMTEMSLEADISRLCRMYLTNLTNIKASLPSYNVEARTYTRKVKQYSVSTAKAHLQYLGGGGVARPTASMQGSTHSS